MITDELLQKLKTSLDESKYDQLKLAFFKAEQAHKGQKRYNGDPYIVHPLRVCLILTDEVNVKDLNTLLMALLHDVVEDTDIKLEEIEKDFGKKIAEGVNYLTKADGYKEDIKLQKKYFWHLKRAPKKVQLVKLADRLDNLREVGSTGNILKIRKYIMDTAYNYLSWAKELNPYIAGEMEDLIFKYRELFGDYDI